MEFKFDLRFSTENDLPFIYNSWLKDYRGSDFAKFINDKDFFTYHHILIEEIIKRPSSDILIACDPEDSNVIYGWVCVEAQTTLHYAYVKASFRGLGIFTKLLNNSSLPLLIQPKSELSEKDSGSLIYTHFTVPFYKYFLLKHKDIKARYCPYLV